MERFTHHHRRKPTFRRWRIIYWSISDFPRLAMVEGIKIQKSDATQMSDLLMIGKLEHVDFMWYINTYNTASLTVFTVSVWLSSTVKFITEQFNDPIWNSFINVSLLVQQNHWWNSFDENYHKIVTYMYTKDSRTLNIDFDTRPWFSDFFRNIFLCRALDEGNVVSDSKSVIYEVWTDILFKKRAL